jgi:hypothetical protein
MDISESMHDTASISDESHPSFFGFMASLSLDLWTANLCFCPIRLVHDATFRELAQRDEL